MSETTKAVEDSRAIFDEIDLLAQNIVEHYSKKLGRQVAIYVATCDMGSTGAVAVSTNMSDLDSIQGFLRFLYMQNAAGEIEVSEPP